jgi:hypothetical protein
MLHLHVDDDITPFEVMDEGAEPVGTSQSFEEKGGGSTIVGPQARSAARHGRLNRRYLIGCAERLDRNC